MEESDQRVSSRTLEHNAKIGAANKANGFGNSQTKVCPRCGLEKDRATEFGVRLNGFSRSWCKPCENIESLRWANSNPEKVVENNRRGRLRRHNMTLERYDELLASQGGGCAICGITAPTGKRSNFDIDHDHRCCPGAYSCGECIRGLLCNRCNTLIGRASEDLAILEAAIRYLLGHQPSVSFAA